MNGHDDPSREMQRLLQRLANHEDLRLDENTAERLLDGSISADDAPPRFRFVAQTLDGLRAPTTDTELAGEAEVVASIAARLADEATPTRAPRRSIVGSKRRLVYTATASLIGGLSLFSGLAAANALPGAAQGVASDMLSKVGVSVPNPNSHADTHPNGRGQSGDHAQPPSTTPPNNAKGSTISGLAHTTTSTGVGKGAAISTQASGGKSQAGQHGTADTQPSSSASTPPVSTPNGGGTNTANTASGGKSATGTANANSHSADGSNNSRNHKP